MYFIFTLLFLSQTVQPPESGFCDVSKESQAKNKENQSHVKKIVEDSKAQAKEKKYEVLNFLEATSETPVSLSKDGASSGAKQCKIGNPSKCEKSKENRSEEQACKVSLKKQILYIFVSSSLPKESLKSLLLEAQKIGATLVFRGLINNSFKDTQKYFSEILVSSLSIDDTSVQDSSVKVIIDPNLFEEYDVKVVPTFIMKEDKSGNKYDSLRGHISLEEALLKFRERGELKDIAANLLQQLRGDSGEG